MDLETIVNRLLNPLTSAEDAEQLIRDVKTVEEAHDAAKRLETGAEGYWLKESQSALILANRTVRLGEVWQAQDIIGWACLARANAFLFVGQGKAAWDDYETAAAAFQAINEKVGWARTRSGSLPLSINFGIVTKALEQAVIARDIFSECGEPQRLLQLEINRGMVYCQLGEYRLALEVHQQAIPTALALGEIAQPRLATLYYNAGYAHLYMGDFAEARASFMKSHEIFRQRGEMETTQRSEINLAYVNQAQGDYRRALERLYAVREYFQTESLTALVAETNREIIECYLYLNRFDEARDLAETTIDDFRSAGKAYDISQVLVQLATAQAELSNYPAARDALAEAESNFESLGLKPWLALIHLRRGRIALRQGDTATAHREASTAAVYFDENGERVNYAKAILLDGEVLRVNGNLIDANQRAGEILRIAQQNNLPDLRYAAYLLVGHVAETQGKLERAMRYYFAAAATLDRVQRRLTLTLRPDFLEDKIEALRGLIRLCLTSHQINQAFEMVEWAKSQTYLAYILNRQNVGWLNNEPSALIEELNLLRTQHQWFYRLAYNQSTQESDQPNRLHLQRLLPEITAREQRIRDITERLYLQRDLPLGLDRPSLEQIRSHLSADTLLIEFYNDGDKLWAFTLDSMSLEFHELSITVNELNEYISALEFNFNMTLSLRASPEMAERLIGDAQEQLAGLYSALIAPLESRCEGRERLIIVPYGAIHYLPVNLLYNGHDYLIDCYEIVVLPSAGLVTQVAPKRPNGQALVLTHSDDGKLPYTAREGELVERQFGGTVYYDDLATRAVLQSPPKQVLHIAAHGEHRIDRPDLSYIQLADGQLWVDDLVQLDLSYELITLSACETGRSQVTAWDEVIGIGRGFLMAGAGALLVSLWRVPDDITYEFMEHFYTALQSGVSKAEALRLAQRTFSARKPQLHPVFWGAFQLIGDANPLSSAPTLLKEIDSNVRFNVR